MFLNIARKLKLKLNWANCSCNAKEYMKNSYQWNLGIVFSLDITFSYRYNRGVNFICIFLKLGYLHTSVSGQSNLSSWWCRIFLFLYWLWLSRRQMRWRYILHHRSNCGRVGRRVCFLWATKIEINNYSTSHETLLYLYIFYQLFV